jgi:hypothetical protein
VNIVGVGRDFRRGSGRWRRFPNDKSRPFREKSQRRFFGRMVDLLDARAGLRAIFSSSRVDSLAENGRTNSGEVTMDVLTGRRAAGASPPLR